MSVCSCSLPRECCFNCLNKFSSFTCDYPFIQAPTWYYPFHEPPTIPGETVGSIKIKKEEVKAERITEG
jgi:hypothetical protein